MGQINPDNFESFCDGVTTSGDKGRTTDVIYLNFCKALTLSPSTFLSEWERDGFDELMMMNWSMDEELVGQLYPEGSGQWLNVQMDIMASGAPRGPCWDCAVTYLHQLQ